jgi:Fe-S-cluster containining protein
MLTNNIPAATLSTFMKEFKALTQQMDDAYDQVATANGFVCNGCKESCCETRFYHHTYLEYYLLREGMKNLSESHQKKICRTAAEVCRRAEKNNASYRIMCPLNLKGMCRLYDFRPMICRMHGIAHEFKRPDGIRHTGVGCRLFEKTCTNSPPVFLDRTPFYRQMAELEKKLRSALGLQTKIKMTIAQMILSLSES